MNRVTRMPHLALVAVLGLATLGACGSNDSPSTPAAATSAASAATANPTGAPTTTPAPTSPSGAPTSAESAPTSGEQGAPTAASATPSAPQRAATSSAAAAPANLPTDAGDYGDELIAAWAAGNPKGVASHASPAAAATLQAAKPGKGMMRTACEDGMCSYTNEAGRRVTLTFDAGKIKAGAAHAVTTAKVS